MRTRGILAMALLGSLLGCSALVLDTSTDAVGAGDYTLAGSACDAVPGGGMDICRVTSGTMIASAWTLVIPNGSPIEGGEIDVYYRDVHKSYAAVAGQTMVQIPWKDFFGVPTWTADQDGEVEALLLIRWKDSSGVEQQTKFRGLAKIVVTAPGYDRLPIDSGFAAFSTDCKIQYSTAGRGVVSCK